MKYIVGDIGNTLTKICLLDNNFNIVKSHNVETLKIIKSNNLRILLNKILKNNTNKNILFSSVVPNAYKKIKFFIKKKGFRVYEIKDLNIKKLLKFNIKKFNELGSDRIANAVASFSLYKSNCLVIDFGTATTFDIVLKSGTYEGGVIAPGIKISIYNLKNSTALLPNFYLKANNKRYGKNTKEALNAGFLWGYQGLINNIIKKISLSSKKSYKIILTGGYASFFKKFINKKSIIDKNITIKGIIKIYREIL